MDESLAGGPPVPAQRPTPRPSPAHHVLALSLSPSSPGSRRQGSHKGRTWLSGSRAGPHSQQLRSPPVLGKQQVSTST